MILLKEISINLFHDKKYSFQRIFPHNEFNHNIHGIRCNGILLHEELDLTQDNFVKETP